eukprot:1065423-Amphidinium_carterae.1
MDTTNVQHLVEKLVAEWSHLETADREAAMGWARDAGRSHGFDVREVLGSTGIPGQNGWKERPRLPRDWPPPQLVKGKDKGKAAADLKEAEVVRRPYPFGPIARQQREEVQRREERSAKQAKNTVENKAGRSARDEKRGRSKTRQAAPRVDKRAREDQSDQSDDSALEHRDERRGKYEQSARRADRLPSDPRGGRDELPTAGNRRTFRLIPAQDVKKEDKGAKGDSSNKRRDRSEARGARATLSLKEKKQRGPEGDTERRGGRYSPSQSECSRTEVVTGKRGRQRSLRKEIRRAVESSPSSSLGRLLQEVASSSDECIERKVIEAKKISQARVQGRRRVKEEDYETVPAGSDSAPDLFKRLRKSGMSPLQVGKVAAELQVLALAVESKEDVQAHAAESPLLGQAGMLDPSTPVATLSEVLAKTCEELNEDTVVVTGRGAAKAKAKGRSKASKSKEKTEDLAQALYKGLREGTLSEKERWEALDSIVESLAMAKARNGVKILQLGAMRARGRQHAAADKHYPKVTAAIQEFISTHGP